MGKLLPFGLGSCGNLARQGRPGPGRSQLSTRFPQQRRMAHLAKNQVLFFSGDEVGNVVRCKWEALDPGSLE